MYGRPVDMTNCRLLILCAAPLCCCVQMVREGTDVSIFTYSRMRYVVMQAVAELEKKGYNPEVSTFSAVPFLTGSSVEVRAVAGRCICKPDQRAHACPPRPRCLLWAPSNLVSCAVLCCVLCTRRSLTSSA